MGLSAPGLLFPVACGQYSTSINSLSLLVFTQSLLISTRHPRSKTRFTVQLGDRRRAGKSTTVPTHRLLAAGTHLKAASSAEQASVSLDPRQLSSFTASDPQRGVGGGGGIAPDCAMHEPLDRDGGKQKNLALRLQLQKYGLFIPRNS